MPNIFSGKLNGVKIIEPTVFEDSRGFFYEVHNEKTFESFQISRKFVQDNISFSCRGVLRGLHFQNPQPQAKLVCVLSGEIYDVVVDLRRSSPTFGQWECFEVKAATRKQLFVPEGFAHGFQVLSESASILYKCDDFYNPKTECSLLWNDPDLNIQWPIENPIMSPKDGQGFRLKDLPPTKLFD